MRAASSSVPAVVGIILVLGLSAISLTADGVRAVFNPTGHSLAQIERALDQQATTSADLVDHYLKRIDQFEDDGPQINAITAINGLAKEQARDLDTERQVKGKRGPLHGIPFVVKANYDVLGMATTGGSVALANNYPSKNSFVVQRLIDAGAIVLAKTNMSGLASSSGRYGYSSVGGLTLNPYNLKRNASGSSSGTAAAVAADFAPFGLGTDTSGSIRGPASVTGLVGIRPSYGLTSHDGVLPLSRSFDTTGPITQTAADAALVLQTISGTDSADPTTASAEKIQREYFDHLDMSVLKDARIGVLTSFFGGNDEVDQTVNQAITKMRAHGADIEPVTLGEDYQSLYKDVLEPVSEMELAAQIEDYLSEAPAGTPKNIKDIIAVSSTKGVRESATPVNPDTIEVLRTAVKERSELGGAEYERLSTDEMPRTRRRITKQMNRLDLDALLFPTMACVASPRFDQSDPTYSCDADDPYAASYIGSVTGLPETTVPIGIDSENLPIGVSFLGRNYDEQTVINLAYAWEQVADISHTPPTTDD